MNELQQLIVRRIRRDGPIDFATYMDLALYHPELGYYSSGSVRSDWAGHFLTSPQLDPAFGGLWARGLEEVWEACGQPDGFTVIEIGPGEGGFARGVLSAVAGSTFRDALRYVLIERLPALRARQAESLEGLAIDWEEDIGSLGTIAAGAVFANEVLDNAPVHLVRAVKGTVTELLVGEAGGSLHFVESEPGAALSQELAGRPHLPEDGLYEVGLAAGALVETAARALDRGAMVVVDYGDDAAGLARRPEGSLVCYSAAGADDRPLESPGEKDITVHVNWTSIAARLDALGWNVSRPTTQRAVLRRLGAQALDTRLRTLHDEALAAGDGSAAVRALSRRQAVAALSDPGGLGGLGVLTAYRGIEEPSFAVPEVSGEM